MYFDYFIVLVFVAAGGLYHLARQPAGSAKALAESAQPEAPFSAVAVTCAFLAALSLLFPWALVLHDCLFDRGPAQSLGIGASALAAGALFVAILLIGAWHARKSD